MTFWAKPDQSYEEHLELAFREWRETIDQSASLIKQNCQRFQISEERFLQGSLLCVALHDIGKMIAEFQSAMVAIQKNRRPDWDNYYRHELASFSFVMLASRALNVGIPLVDNIPLEAAAVLGHHKLLDINLSSFEREKGKKPGYIPEGIDLAISLASDFFTRHNWTFPSFDWSCVLKDFPYIYATKVFGLDGFYGTRWFKPNNTEKLRWLYAILKAILHSADWHASAGLAVRFFIDVSREQVTYITKKRLEHKKLPFLGWNSFQERAGKTSGNVIAIAPTGSGKTEASLLWAANNLQQQVPGGKIIYLLPTMATANSMYRRLCDFFGQENVGLCHSSANLFLENTEEAEIPTQDVYKNFLFDKTFVRPVTVATVDQFLTTGFHFPHWTLKELESSLASVIIDEVHAYEPWTIGLILSSIRHFSRYGTRFFVMSATMPAFLRLELEKNLHSVTLLEDDSLRNNVRSRYCTTEIYLMDNIKAIEDAVISGNRTLVVANTVSDCQELTKALRHLNPLCCHSKFIFRDRVNIETRLTDDQDKSIMLVVATQVVEVSLDIDFDWMFTECAPPDALVQRAGRINRARRNLDSRIFIHPASDAAHGIYDPHATGLLDNTFASFRDADECLSESDLTDVVDRVYRDISLTNSLDFAESIKIYAEIQWKRLAIYDSLTSDVESENRLTRRSTYPQVDVIPDRFLEHVLTLKPVERRWFELKMPLWYVVGKGNGYLHEGIRFCKMGYDNLLGADLEKSAALEMI